MTVNNFLNKTVKEIEGNLLGIGIDNQQILNSISKNKNIRVCNLLDSVSKEIGKGKTHNKVKISKLRKKFKKKKNDYMIINLDTVRPFIKKIVPDSIYLNKKYLYIYDKNLTNLDNIKKYYSRYDKALEEIKCKDGIILKICTNCNTNFLKEFIFKISNFIYDIFNLITELLLD